jgi:hypothetical protein
MSSLPIGYKIRAKGYRLSGDVRTGLKATIPFIMPWSLGLVFCNSLIPSPIANALGTITWTPPYQLPIVINGQIRPLYAQSWDLEPCGYNGTPATSAGLSPGDYFSTALVTVQFDGSSTIQQTGDDPSNLNQLDTNNPLTMCEQSVDIVGKMETVKGSAYKFASTGKPVPGEKALLRNEVKLVLKFPRIPLLPWQLVQPYVGKVNSSAILNCVKGSLLLEGMTTIVTPAPDGQIAQNLGLKFAFNPDPSGTTATGMDWNSEKLPDGSGYSLIAAAGGGGQTPYSYVNFGQIFTTLSYGL